MGNEKKIISKLSSINGVTETHGTFGLYDIFAKVEADNDEEIQKIVTNSIRQLPEIHSTMTLTR